MCLFLYVCFGTMYLAPSISATYRLVTARERALALRCYRAMRTLRQEELPA